MSEICVLVVDDEIIIARDLERIVSKFGVGKIVVATNPQQALAVARTHRPSLTLMDINLEAEIDGVELSEQIRSLCESEIIFITAYADDETLQRAKADNPLSFVLKPFDDRQVAVVIDLALHRLQERPPGVVEHLAVGLYEALTHAEKRILSMIARNLTSVEIARLLGIANKTVENHRSNICKKLDLPAEKNSLLRYALQHKGELLFRDS